MIELKQLSKTYHTNNQQFHALKNVGLSIQQGEIYGILGKSGAGKSTLLRCVNLLEKPTKGQVIVNHIDLTSLTKNQLKQQRRKISMIFQHFNLLDSRTAFGNIALPLELIGTPKAAIEKKVTELLTLVQLENRSDYFPSQLSGGQKQRIAIARALATDPEVLLCDEATSSLDVNSTHAILNLLKEINKKLKLTILLITHELEVVKQICDRVGILDQGKLVEQGSVIDIFAKPKSIITKKLVQKAQRQELSAFIKGKIKANIGDLPSILVRLTFFGQDSDQPLLSTLIKKFNISINILQANIEQIQNATIGHTLCQIIGSETATQQALQYLQSLSINVEVLDHA